MLEAHLANLVGGLVVAGYDTTMTMLGNSLLYILWVNGPKSGSGWPPRRRRPVHWPSG
ncbi:hypothetical protein ACFYXP_39580 [Streptomyces sp. NPDC002466]|uniref:hypothetical protein n=1 Tax=unclassified Streptomyces TaxID=2593676 RepID=UPI0021CCD349|nr:hypothetical protein [Streptomyces sp. sk2.1]